MATLGEGIPLLLFPGLNQGESLALGELGRGKESLVWRLIRVADFLPSVKLSKRGRWSS